MTRNLTCSSYSATQLRVLHSIKWRRASGNRTGESIFSSDQLLGPHFKINAVILIGLWRDTTFQKRVSTLPQQQVDRSVAGEKLFLFHPSRRYTYIYIYERKKLWWHYHLLYINSSEGGEKKKTKQNKSVDWIKKIHQFFRVTPVHRAKMMAQTLFSGNPRVAEIIHKNRLAFFVSCWASSFID